MVNKLTIGYFADGPWSHNTFEHLINDESVEIRFVVTRWGSPDTTLKDRCEKHNIPYFSNVRVNTPQFVEEARKYGCDLFVSMSFDQIFKQAVIDIPRLGIINCHAGKLPFYRGRNILNWALINDERSFGITVHFIDEGIDTGDIILQQEYSIEDHDDYGTLLKRAHTECATVLYNAVKSIQSGDYSRTPQSSIHPIGFYCAFRGEEGEPINWNQSSRQVFNFIRALCVPGPMAYTHCNGNVVKINKARLIEGAPAYIGIAGQIVGKTRDGFIVKTLDTTIEILDIHTDHKLKIGDKLK